ncbi:Early meiotic induction protein [Lachnellula occidentalis]|uniref:Early meiotic induction protein n=1 Tax=Lachnellula occidentalis TaxID=215460 RepID=A0A8H8S430_9HELO|nr:Early meiotic induction protein [Lachnellula occidentalis]
MGWLWTTPTPASASPTPSSSFPPDQKDNGSPPPQPVPEAAPSKPLSKDEIAEKELHSLFEELDADVRPSSTKYSRVGRAAPPQTSSTPEALSNAPLSEQLLPTTMSCREAFDSAFYCNSFGGKFQDIYRQGSLQPCSEHWSKFWFCMRTRQWSTPEKEEAIRGYYRKVEAKKYKEGSSEDLWKSREAKVPVDTAFKLKFEPFPGENDDEWNRLERERREAEKKKLGYT